MGFDQYHEPPEELSAETRTFARMITSLIEEAEAIGWYEQRLSLEKDRQAHAIMKNAQHEEMKHFGMDLEFLLRKKPQWREVLEGILFTTGDIVKLGDEAEESSDQDPERRDGSRTDGRRQDRQAHQSRQAVLARRAHHEARPAPVLRRGRP